MGADFAVKVLEGQKCPADFDSLYLSSAFRQDILAYHSQLALEGTLNLHMCGSNVSDPSRGQEAVMSAVVKVS